MSVMTSENYEQVVGRLKNCLVLLSPKLTTDAVEHIQHYIVHGELEMAYETLVLSCIKEGVEFNSKISEELLSIGKILGMETEAVFECNFWSLAQEYIARFQ